MDACLGRRTTPGISHRTSPTRTGPFAAKTERCGRSAPGAATSRATSEGARSRGGRTSRGRRRGRGPRARARRTRGRGVGVGVGGGGGVVVRIRRRASATSPAIAGRRSPCAQGASSEPRGGRVHEVSETSPGGACAQRVHRTARGRREGFALERKISGAGDDSSPPAGARRDEPTRRPGCQPAHPLGTRRAPTFALARFE